MRGLLNCIGWQMSWLPGNLCLLVALVCVVVDCNATPICVSKSSIQGTSLTIASAGTAVTFAVTARDALNNLHTGADQFLQAILTSDGPLHHLESTVGAPGATGNDRAKYSFRKTITVSGSYSISLSSAFAGGLAAEYFTNDQMYGSPAKTSVDSAVDFDWINGIPGIGGGRVSARWSGFVQAQYTGVHTIAVTTGSGVRLQFMNRLFFDRWGLSLENTYLATASLAAGSLYPITLEWHGSEHAVAQISLRWSWALSADAVIPSNRLYYGSTAHNVSAITLHPDALYNASSSLNGMWYLRDTQVIVTDVSLHDQYGNTRKSVTTEVDVSIEFPDSSTSTFTAASLLNGTVRSQVFVTLAGTYKIHPRVSGNNLLTVANRVQVDPGEPSIQHSIANSDSLAHSTVGVVTSFSVALRDKFGNPTTSGMVTGLSVTAQHSSGHSIAFEGSLKQPGVMSFSGLPVAKGLYVVSAIDVTTGVHTMGSPLSLFARNSIACAATSTATGAALTKATAGSAATFTITARDADGDQQTTETDQFMVQIYDGAQVKRFFTTAQGNGVSHAVITLTKSGLYSHDVSLGGIEPISGSPFSIHVVPGVVCASISALDVTGVSTVLTVGDLHRFVLTAKDAYSNELTTAGSASFTVSVNSLSFVVQNDQTARATSQWSVTVAGTYSLNVKVSSNHVQGSPISLSVSEQSQSFCATTSTVSSLASTFTQAEAQTFVITTKDLFGSAKQLVDQWPYAYSSQTSTQSFPVSFVHSNTNLYTGSVSTTMSGSFSVPIGIANAGGLMATYYSDEALTTAKTTIVNSVMRHDWGPYSPGYGVGHDAFSIRWKGFVRPSESGMHTFYVRADEGCKLEFLHSEVIDQWDNSMYFESVYTVNMLKDTLYPIEILYHDSLASARIDVEMESQNFPRHILIGPELYYEKHLLATKSYTVAAGEMHIPSSLVTYPPYLFTVGHSTSYSITAKDIYGMVPTGSQIPWSDISLSDGSSTAVHGTVTSLGSAQYKFDLRPTGAGVSQINLGWLTAGGVFATYYGSSDLSLPKKTTTHSSVDMSSTDGGPWPGSSNSISNVSPFSARFAGYFKPANAGEHTFYLGVQSASDESARLYVDGKVSINGWGTASLAATEVSATASLSSTSSYYQIKLDYANRQGSQKIQFSVKTPAAGKALVSSTLMYRMYQLLGYPRAARAERLEVCATTTVATGTAITLSTAFVPATFTITAKDQYHNLVQSVSEANAIAVLRPSSALSIPAVSVSSLNGERTLSFTAQNSASPSLSTPFVVAVQTHYGIRSTYYATNSLSTPWSNRVDRTIDFSGQSGRKGWAAAHSASGDQFAVKWEGFVRTPFAGEYTWKVGVGDTSEGVRLYIDNSLLINQWSTPTAATSFTATSNVVDPSAYHDIRMDYFEVSGDRAAVLKWSAKSIPEQIIPSQYLAAAETVLSTTHNAHLGAAAKSTASGNALTLATSNSAATFSITVKDEFGTTRNTHVDNVACNGTHLVDGDGWHSVASSVGSGVYACGFTVTKSGSYSVDTTALSVGGLQGLYFANVFLYGKPLATRIDSTVDFDWGDGNVGLSPKDYSSIRWVGSIKPAYSETYNIQAQVYEGDGVKVYIDQALLINSWSTRTKYAAVDDSTYVTTVVATIALTANKYHGVRVEFKDISGPAKVRLSWSSNSQSAQAIPSDKMYYPVAAFTPVTQTIKSTGAVCATQASIAGKSLSLATSGFAATFTLTARDSFGNLRDAGGDSSSFLAVALTELKAAQVATLSDQSNGQYKLSYTTTASGALSVHVGYPSSGGLYATYYKDEYFSDPQRTARDTSINFNQAFDGTSESWPGVSGQSLPGNHFSARWTGFLKPTASGTWTFRVDMADGDDMARLYIDSALVVDDWVATSTATQPTGTASLTSGQMHHVKLEYREAAGSHGVKLYWHRPGQSFSLVSSSDMWSLAEVPSSPISGRVWPDVICGTTSSIQGNGLTLATAGISATCTLTVRDRYSNVRDQGLEYARLRGLPTSLKSINGSQTSTSYSVFNFEYTATKAESLPLYVGPLVRGGLLATYYEDAALSSSPVTRVDTSVDFSHTGDSGTGWPNGIVTPSSFSARWHGFIRPMFAQQYTLWFHIAATDEGVRLYQDNSLILDAWSPGATIVSTAITFAKREDFYDITVEYKETSGTNTMQMYWETSYAGRTVTKAIVPSSRLYYMPLPSSNSQSVDVKPNTASHSKTTFSPPSLNSGSAATFTITVKDAWDNPSDSPGWPSSASAIETVRVDLTRTNDGSTVQADMRYQSNGVYHAVVTPPTAGAYKARVLMGLFGGVNATIHSGLSLDYPIAVRSHTSSAMTYDFSNGKPHTFVASDLFSVRWAGALFPRYTSVYTFSVTTAASANEPDGTRLYIGGQPVIDEWSSTSTSFSNTIALNANRLYDLHLDFKETFGHAKVELKWQQANEAGSAAAIPTTRLVRNEDEISGSPFSLDVS